MITSLRMLLRCHALPPASLHVLIRSLSHLGRSRHIAVLLKSLDRLLLPADMPLANTALHACCDAGDARTALEVFRSLRDGGGTPDAASFNAVLLATAGWDPRVCAEVLP